MGNRLSARPWSGTQDPTEFSRCVFVLDVLSDPPRLLQPHEVSTTTGDSGFQIRYYGYSNCIAPPKHFRNECLSNVKYVRGVNKGALMRLLTVRTEWCKK